MHFSFFVDLQDHWCLRHDAATLDAQWRSRPSDSITVVTMFIDLGVFKKGEQLLSYHSPYMYKRWMRTFGKLTNQVVAFIEKDEDIEYFRFVADEA